MVMALIGPGHRAARASLQNVVFAALGVVRECVNHPPSRGGMAINIGK